MNHILSLIIVLNLNLAAGFNIDVKNPIIITNVFDGLKSQFGASVTLATGPGSSW